MADKKSRNIQKSKKVNKDLEYYVNMILSKYYIRMFVVIFIAYYIFFAITYKSISTFFVGILFVIAMGLVIAYSKYLRDKKTLNLNMLTRMSISLGIVLRFCYMFYTNYQIRQHDVYGPGRYGHLNYILDIARNFTLPQTGEDQAYHPPLHHIICAFFYDVGKLFALSDEMAIYLIQLVIVLISSITIIIVSKILEEVKINDLGKFVGVTFFAFYPMNIYASSFYNNDPTFYMFYIFSILYLFKWIKTQSTRNIIYLSLLTAATVLTKKNGLFLFPIIFLVFFVEFVRNRKQYITYLKQSSLYAIIALPLSSLHILRNYILFNQGISYTVSLGRFKHFDNTFYTLFYISIYGLITNPFTINPIVNLTDKEPNKFFLEYLFRSSLFGEWRYPGLELSGSLLVIAALIICFIFIISLGFIKKKDLFTIDYVFIMNIIVLFGVLLQRRIVAPLLPGQNFRYIEPILVSVAYFLGKMSDRLNTGNNKLLKNLIPSCVVLFSLVSTLFILQIGVPK